MNRVKYLIVFGLLALLGCKSGLDQGTKLDKCGDSTNERSCNLAYEKNGTKCYFSDNKCLAVPGPAGAGGSCANISDQTVCETRFDCKFDNNSCIATTADCTNVKDQTSCQNTYGQYCLWNTTASTCEKSTNTPNASVIYNWKKINLPAGTMAELKNFVVSKDNQHAYAYTDDAANGAAAAGLYHSADKGNTWTRFESIAGANDGMVSGKVDPAATECNYDSTNAAPVDLKPTQTGAVLISDDSKGIYLIEGANVKWAICNDVNDSTAGAGGTTQVADFEPEDIKFIDVVDINTVETIAFAQNDDIATKYMLWLKPTTNLQYTGLANHPLRVNIQNNAGTGILGQNQQWMRAGNTYNNDLLLASVIGYKTDPGTGLWRIAAANLPAADGTLPATIGQVADNNRVLFPEDGTEWKGDDGASNLDIKVIGSFNNGGNDEYFAGMKTGGLAHYTGSQTGYNANLSSFDDWPKIDVLGINNFGGKTRVVTDRGLFGVGIDGIYNKANDYHISAFALSNADMMEGTNNAVPFNPSHNPLLVNIFGDDNLAWYWIDSTGVKSAESGLYVREKGRGQVRP